MRLRRLLIFTLRVVTSILLVWVFTPAVIIPPPDPKQAIAFLLWIARALE
ncbi:MAG: hypothetical protein RMX96_30330 [Nostoc sp. ChiSLP02]|nr:hypothetical protein [Nostoc sp. ChiSLP02]